MKGQTKSPNMCWLAIPANIKSDTFWDTIQSTWITADIGSDRAQSEFQKPSFSAGHLTCLSVAFTGIHVLHCPSV